MEEARSQREINILTVGADVTDYFNYGFDEFTWTAYCSKQTNLRNEFNPAKVMAVFLLVKYCLTVDDDGYATRDASDDGSIPHDAGYDVWRDGYDARSKRVWATRFRRRICTASNWSWRTTGFRWRVWWVLSTGSTRWATGIRRAAAVWWPTANTSPVTTIATAKVPWSENWVAC